MDRDWPDRFDPAIPLRSIRSRSLPQQFRSLVRTWFDAYVDDDVSTRPISSFEQPEAGPASGNSVVEAVRSRGGPQSPSGLTEFPESGAALGSTRNRVTSLLLGKVALLLLSGLAIGWMLTLAFRKALAAVVEMHVGHDFLLLSGITAGLAFVGVVASFIPARRAASIEPVQALRSE